MVRKLNPSIKTFQGTYFSLRTNNLTLFSDLNTPKEFSTILRILLEKTCPSFVPKCLESAKGKQSNARSPRSAWGTGKF